MNIENHTVVTWSDKALRDQLSRLLWGGHAHRPAVELLWEFPYEKSGIVLKGLPYSAWSLLEHLRIAQMDIIEFSRDPFYKSPKWPEEYWPESRKPGSEKAWNSSIEQFETGLHKMVSMVSDPSNDLFEPFPHGEGQTLFREAVMLAEHNSYHLGQLVVIGRQLNVW